MNSWTPQDQVSLGISLRAQRIFLESQQWAIDRINCINEQRRVEIHEMNQQRARELAEEIELENLDSQHGGNVQQESGSEASDSKSVGENLTVRMAVEPPKDSSHSMRGESLQGDSEKRAGSNPAESTLSGPLEPPITSSASNEVRCHAEAAGEFEGVRASLVRNGKVAAPRPSEKVYPSLDSV